MADLAGMAALRALFIAEDDSSFFGLEKTGGNAQQSGFSRSIFAGQDKGFSCRQVKGNVYENEIFTAPCSQIFGGELHASALSSLRLSEGSKNVWFWQCSGMASF
ncbi:hypothetical protein GGE45_002806 [Rhizobium aethiopicum]|uniref:Uncharacterized protein n=1 Tax=Rhizobium aethiopicum TaxID=1138170 RepID=A0A7W6Q937_9HYPH|nr:hypothetical protein [Rhizobium aethiopicum]MBB4580471.1 hypothetical protein [Rhizobium aethiopicum]